MSSLRTQTILGLISANSQVDAGVSVIGKNQLLRYVIKFPQYPHIHALRPEAELQWQIKGPKYEETSFRSVPRESPTTSRRINIVIRKQLRYMVWVSTLCRLGPKFSRETSTTCDFRFSIQKIIQIKWPRDQATH